MYRNAYQRGMLTVFFSCGSKPLGIWETHTQDGYITRFLDQDIKSMVLEIGGTNVSTTYMICPKGKTVLGITMPFLVMIVKNLKKYFSFEVTILDETGTRRRFRVSNFQSTTQILPMCTVMPIGLSEGWNQIQFNLAEFTKRAYKKQFIEVQKLKINANIRLRRIYFTERLIPEDQLPPEYKLYFPLASKGKSKDAKGKENTAIEGPTDDRKGSKANIAKLGSKADVKRPSQEKAQAVIQEVQEPPPPAAEAKPAEEAAAPAEAPAEAVAAAEGGAAPAEGGAAPAEGGETPAAGGETPAEGGETPAEGGEKPAEGEAPEGTVSEPATAEPSEPATEGEAPAEAAAPPPEPAAEAAPE